LRGRAERPVLRGLIAAENLWPPSTVPSNFATIACRRLPRHPCMRTAGSPTNSLWFVCISGCPSRPENG